MTRALRMGTRLRTWSLWLVSIGLMLASSGLDGAYMARWMGDVPALGYVLNTMSDVASITLTYWYGRLQFDRSSRKRSLARALLAAEVVAVSYSWFFSYRQLLLVLPETEGPAAQWIAPVAAGFIPLLLAFAGYAQALLAGRIDEPLYATSAGTQSQASDGPATRSDATATVDPDPAGESEFVCDQCDRSFRSQNALNSHVGWHKRKEQK